MTKIKPEDLEKYSSAVTLSDMEVFVFPELFYALILANIMSPLVWKWRDEDCFKKLEGKDNFKKLLQKSFTHGCGSIKIFQVLSRLDFETSHQFDAQTIRGFGS